VQSSGQIVTTNKPTPSFLQDGWPSSVIRHTRYSAHNTRHSVSMFTHTHTHTGCDRRSAIKRIIMGLCLSVCLSVCVCVCVLSVIRDLQRPTDWQFISSRWCSANSACSTAEAAAIGPQSTVISRYIWYSRYKPQPDTQSTISTDYRVWNKLPASVPLTDDFGYFLATAKSTFDWLRGLRLRHIVTSALRRRPGRGSAAGRKFLALPYYSQHAVASLWAHFMLATIESTSIAVLSNFKTIIAVFKYSKNIFHYEKSAQRDANTARWL